jgi:hypothetical protein
MIHERCLQVGLHHDPWEKSFQGDIKLAKLATLAEGSILAGLAGSWGLFDESNIFFLKKYNNVIFFDHGQRRFENLATAARTDPAAIG